MSVKRIDHVVVDELGIDPLRDSSFDAIMSVQRWTPFTITKQYEHNPQSVSDMMYGTVDLWYAILYYNGIADNWEFNEGMEIKIPNVSELTSALSAASAPQIRTQRI